MRLRSQRWRQDEPSELVCYVRAKRLGQGIRQRSYFSSFRELEVFREAMYFRNQQVQVPVEMKFDQTKELCKLDRYDSPLIQQGGLLRSQALFRR